MPRMAEGEGREGCLPTGFATPWFRLPLDEYIDYVTGHVSQLTAGGIGARALPVERAEFLGGIITTVGLLFFNGITAKQAFQSSRLHV